MGDFFKKLWHHFIPSEHNSYRPHLLRSSWLGFFLFIILAAEGFLVTNLAVRQTNENFLAAVVPGEVIALTNVQRTQNDVGTLQENSDLDAAAQAKADDMAAKGYFSHIGPDGKTPWDWITQAGYTYQYAGENLAVQFVDSSDVVNAWMASPTHRANILKSAYTDIGVGVADGTYEGQPATFVVQYFGSPAESAVVAEATPAPSTAAPQPVATPVVSSTSSLTQTNPPSGPTPQVLGAQTAVSAPGSSAGEEMQPLLQTAVGALAHIQAEPLLVTEWVLGVIVALLGITLLLTFFIHVQIQPTHMLTAGATLFVFTLFIMYCNSSILTGAIMQSTQSASVSLGVENISGVVIDSEAATTAP